MKAAAIVTKRDWDRIGRQIRRMARIHPFTAKMLVELADESSRAKAYERRTVTTTKNKVGAR